VLGIRLVHSRPGQPQGRGKIERVFRTVREQFLVELEARGGAKDLDELNRLFGAWVEGVYHHREHAETGQAPIQRFLAGGAPRLPSPAELHQAFLWAEHRQVTKQAIVSLFANRYQVDPALVGATVELVFDPFDLGRIEVRYQQRPAHGSGGPVPARPRRPPRRHPRPGRASHAMAERDRLPRHGRAAHRRRPAPADRLRLPCPSCPPPTLQTPTLRAPSFW
jgi:putative transposase